MEDESSILAVPLKKRRKSRWGDWKKTEKGKQYDRSYKQRPEVKDREKARRVRKRVQNRARHRELRRDQRARARERARTWLSEFKSSASCASCGFSRPAALQFHHEGAKNNTIPDLMGRGSLTALKREITLCVVLCANCHMILHAAELERELSEAAEGLRDSRPMTDWERKAAAGSFWSEFD